MRGLLWLLVILILIVAGVAAIAQWPTLVPGEGGKAIAKSVSQVTATLGIPWPKVEDPDKTEGLKLWQDFVASQGKGKEGSDLPLLEGAVEHLMAYSKKPEGGRDEHAMGVLSEALLKLGYKYKDTDRLDDAIKAFTWDLELDPRNSLALEGRAWSHYLRYVRSSEGSDLDDDRSKAVTDFTNALGIATDASREYEGLKDKPVTAERRQAVETLRARAGQLPNLYVGRGRAYLEQGNFADALNDFDQAIKVEPTKHAGYLWRGYAKGLSAKKTSDLPGFASAYGDFAQAYSNTDDAQKANDRAEVLLYRAKIRLLDPSPSITLKSAMTDLEEAKKLNTRRADVRRDIYDAAHLIIEALESSRTRYTTCRTGKAKDFCKQDTAALDAQIASLTDQAAREIEQAHQLEQNNVTYARLAKMAQAGVPAP